MTSHAPNHINMCDYHKIIPVFKEDDDKPHWRRTIQIKSMRDADKAFRSVRWMQFVAPSFGLRTELNAVEYVDLFNYVMRISAQVL